MRALTAVAFSLAMGVAAVANAQTSSGEQQASVPAQEWTLSAQERQKLDQLSPELRQKVLNRLGPEQRVDGILETMLLNELSSRYPGARSYSVDLDRNTATVVTPDNERRTFQYDPKTLAIKEQQSSR